MLDLTKPMQTRAGIPVTYIGKISGRLVFSKLDNQNPGDIILFHTNDDGRITSNFIDLDCVINVPEKRYMWLNIYSNSCYGYDDPKEAERYRSKDCISTMKIEVPVGE